MVAGVYACMNISIANRTNLVSIVPNDILVVNRRTDEIKFCNLLQRFRFSRVSLAGIELRSRKKAGELRQKDTRISSYKITLVLQTDWAGLDESRPNFFISERFLYVLCRYVKKA